MITIDVGIAGLLVGIVGSVLMLLALALVDTKRDMEHYKEKSCALSRELWTLNPYAHLLGKEVEAKVYAASNWERVVVVAVSWRGAVCVRPVRDMQTKGRWIHKDAAPMRVLEVGNNDD